MTVLAADGLTIENQYQNFIAVSRYARWLDEETRRERWGETVNRYIAFMQKHLSEKFSYDPNDGVFDVVREAILNLEVMPSMRALMTAGPALDRSHLAGYNCSAVAVDHPRAFDEALYISMNGTGVGFSVESRYVDQLPEIPDLQDTSYEIVAEDSKEGWAVAFRELLELLWDGQIPSWDLSKIRPAGAKLKVFGGRASGPGPLDTLFRFTVDVFVSAQGRKLTPIEVHDIMCMVGDCVVSGGVRRSAMISLSDFSDHSMATAKSGAWYEKNGQRALANNSAVYRSKPSVPEFLGEWKALIESQSGERGIFNLEALKKKAAARGRNPEKVVLTNPCGEILLRSKGLCNLSEVVVAPDDTEDDLLRKVKVATIIGTWQSTLTNFRYIRDEWRENAEEERLLGVSLTGIYGNSMLNDPDDPELPEILSHLREKARLTNAAEADRLGINRSASITTVKPSGTVSQLVGVSSGIHPWFAPYYVRTVRGNNDDPITKLLKEYDVPNEPDLMKPETTTVFSFPMKAPDGAVTRGDITALDHLRLWSVYREHWTDHNPSVTINVRDDEWLEVGSWVYENWDKVGGISFLPHTDHVYQQAPYQPITEEEYEALVRSMPEVIHWVDLSLFEEVDSTEGSQTLACTSGACEIVDIGQI